MPKIVCLSDTHNCNHEIKVPDGDILIHAGDATVRGTLPEVEDFLTWFSGLPHRHKIFVAGNHDWLFEIDNRLARLLAAHFKIKYLQDSFVEIEGLKIYGAPWQPRFYDWAFNLDRGAEMAAKWHLIPADIDVLITHGPPHGILDEVPNKHRRENAGCEELRLRVEEISRLNKLKLHVFGHIHCGYGQSEEFGVKFVNASVCDESYAPSQPPIVLELEMSKVIRTDSENEDFRRLVRLLDADLAVRDGAEHAYYAQFNKIDALRNVVVAYRGETAVGCGAFKPFNAASVEIKRMFVLPEMRGQGIAAEILSELERWAVELNFGKMVLETGKKQPEAIRLYQKSGYEPIPNYGQYAGMDNSVCMMKKLAR
jgi:GNAT superfamily N-acetyltransferase